MVSTLVCASHIGMLAWDKYEAHLAGVFWNKCFKEHETELYDQRFADGVYSFTETENKSPRR